MKKIIVLISGSGSNLQAIIDQIKLNNINSITIARMEVPCCSATTNILKQALENSGKNISLKHYNHILLCCKDCKHLQM